MIQMDCTQYLKKEKRRLWKIPLKEQAEDDTRSWPVHRFTDTHSFATSA